MVRLYVWQLQNEIWKGFHFTYTGSVKSFYSLNLFHSVSTVVEPEIHTGIQKNTKTVI